MAEAAGRILGLSEPELVALRRGGLLHDVGRVAISSSIWGKPGSLSTAEWEQVRLHTYHTERVLLRSPALAPIAEMTALHHERIDGSGYHRGLRGTGLSISARVLAAADVYDAMTHDRPHRSALLEQRAAEELRAMVAGGLLDAQAANAVLEASGHAARGPRASNPGGLSDREVEVIGLVARGFSTRQIARQLSIKPKTADHHVEHIYTKIGVSTRAAAGMFAMEHGLVRMDH